MTGFKDVEQAEYGAQTAIDASRDAYERAVINRLQESGFLEIQIRVECLVRCGDGYQDELINAGWHYWETARSTYVSSVPSAAQVNKWVLHDLEVGKSYESANFGIVTYAGIDNLHGSQTYRFRTSWRTIHANRFISIDPDHPNNSLNHFLKPKAIDSQAAVLPCDVQLPGALIKRGVRLSTLIAALESRKSWPEEDTYLPAKPVDVAAVREQAFDKSEYVMGAIVLAMDALLAARKRFTNIDPDWDQWHIFPKAIEALNAVPNAIRAIPAERSSVPQ